MNAFEVLHQTDVWENREKVVIPLDQIDADYAASIIRFLERRARQFHQVNVGWYIHMADGPLAPQGEWAQDAFDREFDELVQADPVEWLHTTSLVRALKERTHRAA